MEPVLDHEGPNGRKLDHLPPLGRAHLPVEREAVPATSTRFRPVLKCLVHSLRGQKFPLVCRVPRLRARLLAARPPLRPVPETGRVGGGRMRGVGGVQSEPMLQITHASLERNDRCTHRRRKNLARFLKLLDDTHGPDPPLQVLARRSGAVNSYDSRAYALHRHPGGTINEGTSQRGPCFRREDVLSMSQRGRDRLMVLHRPRSNPCLRPADANT